jgi:hypothetical protein
MGGFIAVTDDDLARARQDRRFKHELLASSLERLLSELNRLKQANPAADAALTRQMREAVQLAVQLSDRIRRIA